MAWHATADADTNSWPSSKILPDVPQTDDEKTALIDELQDWKTTHYQEIVGQCLDLASISALSVDSFWTNIVQSHA